MRDLLTTGLELAGAVLLIAGGYLLLGTGLALMVAGGLSVAAAFLIERAAR